MSAFVKRQPGMGRAGPVDLGTRPGLNGQVLISTGVAGLDKLLGGGLPLGSLLLIIEDAHSQQHLSLLKCFLAEGVCCKHSLALISGQQEMGGLEAVAAFLPDQAKSSSSSSSSGSVAGSGTQPTSTPSSSRPAAAGTAAAAAAGSEDDGLKIAWQYRKYIQNQQRAEGAMQSQQPDRTKSSSGSSSSTSSAAAAAKAIAAGIGREWCHQFDFTKSLSVEAVRAAKLQVQCCCTPPQQQGAAAVHAAAASAGDFLARFQPKGPIPVPSRDPGSIGRLVLQSLGSPDWWPQAGSSSSSWQSLEGPMLAAVARLRLAVQDATCAAVVTCPASLYSESFQAQLQHLADVVLCVQSLADNSDVYRLLPDPTSAATLLEVRRVPDLGLLRQRYAEDRLFVIRMKRRSISVGVLDLIPLEAAASNDQQQQQGKPGGAAEKPAAAKICGSGPAGAGGGLLDF